MNKLGNLLAITFLSVFLFSCDNELELDAPWKETMVVYGLLNPVDSVQHIRISRVFSGQGGAAANAAADSGIYKHKLEVILERKSGSFTQEKIILLPDSTVPKDPGAFPSPFQVVYKTKSAIKQGARYDLTIRNPVSGVMATSSCTVIDKFSVSATMVFIKDINWYGVSPFTADWNSAAYGKVYQLTIRFHYSESAPGSGDTVNKFADIIFPQIKSKHTSGGELLSSGPIEGKEFYRNIASKIKAEQGVKRFAGDLEFIITAVGEDLDNYIEINKPSNSVVQEKPVYSNIINGLGVFSSRSFYSIIKPMNKQSLDSLSNGSLTGKLGFQ